MLINKFRGEINMQELIKKWKGLNKQANRLLNEHKSFIKYNSIRLKMDEIEAILYEQYGIEVGEL